MSNSPPPRAVLRVNKATSHIIRARELVQNGPDQQEKESANRLADGCAMEQSKNISPR